MPDQLPANLYYARDVRELERLAMERFHIPGYTLMERAGTSAFDALHRNWPEMEQVVVFCGPGNNGGDGYIVAALARQADLHCKVIYLAAPENLHGSARRAFELARQRQVPMEQFDPFNPNILDTDSKSVIVDALLGTGLSGEVRADYVAAIKLINSSGLPVLAADIPSGLCSDTGKVLGCAVKAALTISFIGLKLGQVINCGEDCCGRIEYDDLDVPEEIFCYVTPAAKRDSIISGT